MTRQERLSIHKKQERLQVQNGVPNAYELREGVPILSLTSEGLVEYVRYNGILYKKVYSRSGDDDLKVKGNFAANDKKPLEAPDYTTTNVTTDRTFNANSTSEAELADILGTLIKDLERLGFLKSEIS